MVDSPVDNLFMNRVIESIVPNGRAEVFGSLIEMHYGRQIKAGFID